MGSEARQRTPGWWAAVGAIALAGLALRILAARGALWTDEAWSTLYAAQARDAAGVFLRINHDNNHHLYSLWLQAIGIGAPPWLARAPAILAGSLAVVAAAVFAGRRSASAGLVAALLFAFSPMFLVYGSEARGYAPMLLAALAMLVLVGDHVDGRPGRGTRWWLGALALAGMFSHLTMAAPVAILALWTYFEKRAADGPEQALRSTLSLMGPAIAAVGFAILFVIVAAALSPTGMRVGGYEAFAAGQFAAALDDLSLWSAGLSFLSAWLVPLLLGALALVIAARPPAWLGNRARLYALMILAVPVAVALLRPGNASFARYYFASALGLLLLLSEWVGRGLGGRGSVRAGAMVLTAALVGVSLYRDAMVIHIDRGSPERPVADMARLAPQGARLAFDAPRLKAVVALAAARSDYRPSFASGCAPAEFLLAAQSRWRPTPRTVRRCGVAMVAIDSSVAMPLSGDSWVLYRAQSLPSRKAADSGPAPGALHRRPSGRAGVAQG